MVRPEAVPAVRCARLSARIAALRSISKAVGTVPERESLNEASEGDCPYKRDKCEKREKPKTNQEDSNVGQ